MHPVAESQESTVQGLPSVQLSRISFTHAPDIEQTPTKQ